MPNCYNNRHLTGLALRYRTLQFGLRRYFDVTIRKSDGFALIDLIFVCGIIGLISSIAVPRLVLAKQAPALRLPLARCGRWPARN